MPRDSQGNFTNSFNWEQDAANGIDIVPDRHQSGDDDQAQGLTDSLDRLGRGGMQADLQLGNNKLVQVQEGTTTTDAPNIGQIQDGAFSYSATDTGVADAYVVSLLPSVTSYTAGLTLSFIASNANTGASTLQVDAVVPGLPIEWQGIALVSGSILAGDMVTVRCDGTAFQMIDSPQVLPVEYGGTGTTALGTAAYEDVGTAIGNVTQLIDDGGGNATMPAVNAELLTNTIAGQTVENVVDPATDLIAFYDDSALANRQTIVQTLIDEVLAQVPPTDPDQLAQAWVVFTGSTATIRASFNVSGVVRNAAGDYTITFTAPFATARSGRPRTRWTWRMLMWRSMGRLLSV